MAEIGRKKQTHIKSGRMTEFKQHNPSLVSSTKKGVESAAKSILSGIQRAAGRVATKEEIRELDKGVRKVAGSKEAKAVGGFLNKWASLYDEEPRKKPAKTCSCPCATKRKKMVKSTKLSKRR